jgi:hypothetical protein
MQSETQGRGHTFSTKLTQARRVALEAVQLANDVKILIQWLNHDRMALTVPELVCRTRLLKGFSC